MAKAFPPNSYFIKPTSRGLEFIYVTPCGTQLMAAIIPPDELENENPGIEMLMPVIGVNGFIKIGKLLEDWLKNRKKGVDSGGHS